MHYKKAQVIGQVFVFILALLIFVLVITYGYKAINIFLEKQALLNLVQFKNNLENSVKLMNAKPGSSRNFLFNIPSNTQELCFVDLEETKDLEKNKPLIHSLSKSGKNVFLLPKPSISLFIENIRVEDGYCCITPKGKFNLKLENVKNKVYIYPVSEKCKK